MSNLLTIEAGYREILAAAGLDSFDALMHADVGEIVTQRNGRETRRVVLGDGDKATTVYIKRCFSIGPKHSIWPRLVGRSCHTPPIKEAKAIAMCKAAGIPTVDVIASGESRVMGIPRAGFVVMSAAPMEWTLNDWLTIGYARPRELTPEERVGLMQAVGELVSQFIRAGVEWPDLKAKHIHAQPLDDGNWRFCVIDLERAYPQRRGSGGSSLAGGKTDWSIFTSLAPADLRHEEILAFWSGLLHDSASIIETPGTRSATVYSGADARAGGDAVSMIDYSASFTVSRFGRDTNPRLVDDWRHPNTLPMAKSFGMRVDLSFQVRLQAAGLASYADVMAYSVGDRLDKPGLASYRERIRLRIGEGDNTETVYLKRYGRPPLREQLRRMWEFKFRRGSAEREMHFARHLGLLGISTMRRIAFGSRMRGWFEQSGFGITGEVAGESLEKLTEKWSDDPGTTPTPADRREIVDQLAKIVFRLHSNGLFHRDLYLCHIFMSRRSDGQVVLSVIDLGRMIRAGFRFERWRIKDLAALAYSSPSPLVTRADRIRFLYHYTQLEARGDRAAARQRTREIIALIKKRVVRMAKHDVRRKRRLEQA